MRYELFIGMRYLRAKRREAFISLITLISTAGIAIGVIALTITLAVMTGFERDLRQRILAFNPHVSVWSALGTMMDYDEVATRARAIPGVAAAEPFVYGQLMLSTPDQFAGVLVRGVPPVADANPDLARHLSADSQIEDLGRKVAVPLSQGHGATAQLPGIIVGEALAKKLGVGKGGSVRVAAAPTGTAGVPRLSNFAVVGTFKSGMPEYDSGLAYVALADGQDLYDMAGAATGVELRLTDLTEAEQIASQLSHDLGGGYRVRSWMEANRNLFSALRLQKTVYSIVLLLIVLVAGFTVLATLIMVVMEKRKDIAILKSMGATASEIARIFIYKGLVIAVAGVTLGNLGGWLGCVLLARYQFVPLPPDVFFVNTIPVEIYPPYFLYVTIAALLICLVATLYPARQAARLSPVDVIRYE
jgi:lipoprotein-releasing system permease protein